MISIFVLYFCNPALATKADTSDHSKKTILDSISNYVPPTQAFHEVVDYGANNRCLSIKHIKLNWAGKKAYIEKTYLKKENANFIRVRIYILSINPAGIHCGSIVPYYRESWYNKDDEQFIDGELHPYSRHKKALVDLNLFWDDPEYVGKTYKVNNTVLRNMTQTEKEIILVNAGRLLFVLNY